MFGAVTKLWDSDYPAFEKQGISVIFPYRCVPTAIMSSGKCDTNALFFHISTTASPKPSFRAPWRVGDNMVGRGNAGSTASKNRHP